MGGEETLKKKQYQVLKEIGRGRFGTVFRCFHATSNRSYAVKVIDKRLLTDSTDRNCLENESKFSSFLSPHPNVVKIFDSFEDTDFTFLVLELCETLTLFERMAELGTDSRMPEEEAATLIKQLLEAIAHCHRLGIAHRDIKPENVLFELSSSTSGNYIVKLADFGSAEWFGLGGGKKMSGVVGTPYYVAPEVILGRDYDEKIDVWSVGVILYTMLSGNIPPFNGESAVEIFEAVIRANLRFPTRIFNSVSSPAKDLLRKILCRDPFRRISAQQALRHPWIMSGGGVRT